jgi:hypothetical protein
MIVESCESHFYFTKEFIGSDYQTPTLYSFCDSLIKKKNHFFNLE